MLAHSRSTPFNSPDYLFEFKWDGIRCLACRLHRQLKLVNRRGRDVTARYPELADLNRLPPGTVLDGEIVALVRGVPSFSRLMKREHLTDTSRIRMASRRNPVVFAAFDVLFALGRNLMHKTIVQRKDCVHELVQGLGSPRVIESEHVIRHGKAVFNEAVRLGFEGIVAKRIGSRYQPGERSDEWLKIKPARTGHFKIIGFIPADDRRRIRALIIGEMVAGRLELRGKVGSGFTERDRRDLFARFDPMPPWRDPPPGGPPHAQWRQTGNECVVRYFEKTEDGKLRAPVFQGLV